MFYKLTQALENVKLRGTFVGRHKWTEDSPFVYFNNIRFEATGILIHPRPNRHIQVINPDTGATVVRFYQIDDTAMEVVEAGSLRTGRGFVTIGGKSHQMKIVGKGSGNPAAGLSRINAIITAALVRLNRVVPITHPVYDDLYVKASASWCQANGDDGSVGGTVCVGFLDDAIRVFFARTPPPTPR